GVDRGVGGVDGKSGAQVWMRPLPVRPSAGVVLAGSSLVVTGQPAQLRVFTTKDGTAALGEPIAPGAPAQPPLTIGATYFPGADIPHVGLNETELAAALPSKIPSEIEIDAPAAPKPSPIASDAESAAPPHVVEDPDTQLPMMLVVTKDVARGAGVTLVRREFDPPVTPLSPLPNLVMIAPQTRTTPP